MKSISFFKVDYKKLLVEMRVWMIILAILSIAIGVLLILAPLVSSGVILWVALGLFGLAGLAGIVSFFVHPKGQKGNPSALILGIVAVLLIAGIIVCACFAKPVNFEGHEIPGFSAFTMNLLYFFGIFFGVFAIVENIALLCTSAASQIEHKGWLIAGSILGIIIGILMIIFPILMIIVSMYLSGAYAIFFGICTIVLVIKHRHDKIEGVGVAVVDVPEEEVKEEK